MMSHYNKSNTFKKCAFHCRTYTHIESETVVKSLDIVIMCQKGTSTNLWPYLFV